MDDKKPAGKKRNLLKTVLLIVLAVVIAAVIFYNGILNKIERFDDTLGTMSWEELAEYLSTADDADLAPDASMITEPETFDVIKDDEEPCMVRRRCWYRGRTKVRDLLPGSRRKQGCLA